MGGLDDGHERATPFGPDPLTPLALLERTAQAHPNRPAVRDGDIELSYGELRDRCRRAAGFLRSLGVAPGDRVSVLAPNTHVMLEAHFAVPAAQAVLNTLNTRLSVGELAYIVSHAGSRVLLCDHLLLDLGKEIAAAVDADVQLIACGGVDSTYEVGLASAEPAWEVPADELDLLSLNYTSGTTGAPKGVMYAHRGAYLQALAMVAQARMSMNSTFLWTLPMFHCNGWCFPWAVTAVGALHLTLREPRPEAIWRAIRDEGATHFNAAPTVLAMLADHEDAAPVPHPVTVATGGAPPSPALIRRLEALGISVTHLYGLTETYGPAAICEWRPEWDCEPEDVRARLRARQGVANVVGVPLRVVDGAGNDVPADGETRGEVVLRGNNVMLGYYRDREATRAATLERPDGSWFRTGDIGVMHPDGYVELRDRAKDVIISGGENIASIEVEQALDTHPAVLECAVVASPDPTWGEVPVAFVTLRPGASATEQELIEFVKGRIARFKAPRRVLFEDLPKTSTGKIQKFQLRARLQGRATT